MLHSTGSVDEKAPRPLSKAERRVWEQSINNAGSRILQRYEATVRYLEALLRADVYVVVRDGVPHRVFESRHDAERACDQRSIAYRLPVVRSEL